MDTTGDGAASQGRGQGQARHAAITTEMVAQFMSNQESLNSSLQEANAQIGAQLRALMSIIASQTTAPGASGTTTSTPSTGAYTPATGISAQATDALVAPAVGSRKPKHTVPHPEKFTGEDEAVYPIFRGLLQAKLQTDGDAIGGEFEKVWYAFGRLTETASKRIFPWLQHMQSSADFTVDRLFDQMDLAFLDVQKQAKAVAKINIIKQRNRTFRDFLQEFDQTLMEANGWSWQDPIKKGLLKAAITDEVRRELVGRDEPATYSAYVAQLRKITDDLEDWKEGQKFKGRLRAQHTDPQDQASNGQMDWEPTQTVSAASAKTTQQGKPKAKWVSQQELDRRREANECLRCGSNDHFIRQCSLGPARRPEATTMTAGAKKPKIRIATTKTKSKRRAQQAVAIIEGSTDSEESGSDYRSENE
jgi:hypothetical protein